MNMKNPISVKGKKTELASRFGEFFPFGSFAFSLSRLRDEFDRFLDRMSQEFFTTGEANGEGWRWDLDVTDEDDKVVVRAEAPGFDVDDFDVRVEDSRLVLSASKKVETKDEKGKMKEYSERECYESITLPAGIDKERVDASYSNGVLTVTLAKTESSKAKRIAVKAK
jgi:HSP20 family protein